MKLTGVELRRISMPLVAPFRTSFGVETTRDILLLRAVLDGNRKRIFLEALEVQQAND